MEICRINHNKKEYLELLLLADEQESMIDRYLKRGDMYALYDMGEVQAVCVVTEETEEILELTVRLPCLFMKLVDSHNRIESPAFLWITMIIRS